MKPIGEHPARVTITRAQNLKTSVHCFRIEVEDDTSRLPIVRVQMTPEHFALALGACGYQPAIADWGRPDLIGYRHEVKCELIAYNFTIDGDERTSKQVVAPYEVDGWTCTNPDLRNFHNRRTVKGERKTEIVLHRFVHPETKRPHVDRDDELRAVVSKLRAEADEHDCASGSDSDAHTGARDAFNEAADMVEALIGERT